MTEKRETRITKRIHNLIVAWKDETLRQYLQNRTNNILSLFCYKRVITSGHQVIRTATFFILYFNYWNKKIINLANSKNPDETAHKEPSHLYFRCLQMYVRIYPMSENASI